MVSPFRQISNIIPDDHLLLILHAIGPQSTADCQLVSPWKIDGCDRLSRMEHTDTKLFDVTSVTVNNFPTFVQHENCNIDCKQKEYVDLSLEGTTTKNQLFSRTLSV